MSYDVCTIIDIGYSQAINLKTVYVRLMLVQILTSKFHREFMSPALFLFELLKMSKLTRGPLVLYHLPKYWSRKKKWS